jgi:chitosanase
LQAQDYLRDQGYFNPALALAKKDGVVSALGQFAYYDAAVMHGSYDDPNYNPDLYDIRKNALAKAKSPAQGGTEKAYLKAFLDARKAAMLAEAGHSDTSRVDTMQAKFLNEGNLNLNTPLSWSVYGDPYTIK